MALSINSQNQRINAFLLHAIKQNKRSGVSQANERKGQWRGVIRIPFLQSPCL